MSDCEYDLFSIIIFEDPSEDRTHDPLFSLVLMFLYKNFRLRYNIYYNGFP